MWGASLFLNVPIACRIASLLGSQSILSRKDVDCFCAFSVAAELCQKHNPILTFLSFNHSFRMDVDSLLDELNSAVDEGLKGHHRCGDTDAPAALPYVAALSTIQRSHHLLSVAQATLAKVTTKGLDYQSFVRFLADTPVPIVQ